MSEREYWSGDKIVSLADDEIFVFGSNPEGRHGAGAANDALKFGAVYYKGRGLHGQTYALITKNLKPGFVEKATNIVYKDEGYRSVSETQLKANIAEFYAVARSMPEKRFLVVYKLETWPNGSPKKSLNGYTAQDLLKLFAEQEIPNNVVFHTSFKQKLELLKPKQHTFFFHLTSPFSNFHPSFFVLRGYMFCSGEQYIMFSKAKLFNDEAIAKQIMSFNEQPLIHRFITGQISSQEIVSDKKLTDEWKSLMNEIKKLGRKVANFDETIMNARREKIALYGSLAKYEQNSHLRQALMATGTSLMVEASPYDKIWGNGLSEYDSKKTPVNQWPGLNIQGKILDETKKQLQYSLTHHTNAAIMTPSKSVNPQSELNFS